MLRTGRGAKGDAMNSEAEWQKALKASPDDATVLLAYGDWLEEQGDQLGACQARQKAGVGELVFRLTHPRWGGELVGEFARLAYLKSHVRGRRRSGVLYSRGRRDTPVPISELVVVIEWRVKPTEIARRPYSADLQV
jgi:uncharacterized protein (TIGR02996 family)